MLRTFLQINTASLPGTIRSYVQRMGLASGDSVPEVALEILQETTIEALVHAERFDLQAQPMAWLLGIAMNMIRRERVASAKRSQREGLLGQLARRYSDVPDENDLLDAIAPPSNPEIAQIVESEEQVEAWLALVPVEDQQILRLALLDEYTHRDLAQKLEHPLVRPACACIVPWVACARHGKHNKTMYRKERAMHKRANPSRQRLLALRRYINAMEQGDAEAAAAVLHEAGQDQALEQLILELNIVYQEIDQSTVSVQEAHKVYQHLLTPVVDQEIRRLVQSTGTCSQYDHPLFTADRHTPHAQRLNTMNEHETIPMPRLSETRLPGLSPVRKSGVGRLIQTLAAVLIACALGGWPFSQ